MLAVEDKFKFKELIFGREILTSARNAMGITNVHLNVIGYNLWLKLEIYNICLVSIT